MNKNRLLNAASETVVRFLSNHFPLKTTANDVIKAKKLNSRERKILLDLVFAYSRECHLLYDFLEQKIRFFKGAPKQKQDLLALELLAQKLNIFSDEAIAPMAKEYEQYLVDLGGKRYLKSLAYVGEVLEKDYGAKALDIAQGLFLKPKKYLATDERKISLNEVKSELKKLKIDYEPHGIFSHALGILEINLKDLPKKISSNVWLMDAGSQIISELFLVKPQSQVLDMCAGEGGKALFITQKDCHYVAMDIDKSRLKVARARLADRDVEFIEHDALTKDFSGRQFDWILLDAPCSGTGVIRRNPDLIHRLGPKDVSNYIEIQRKLLNKAVQLLKPNGCLIYATCSLFKAENEEQIERVLRENKEIIPLSLSRLVGERLNLPSELLVNSCLTLYPHIHDCDGFFIACLSKSPS